MSTKTMLDNAVTHLSNSIAHGRVARNNSLQVPHTFIAHWAITGSHFNVSFRQNPRRSIRQKQLPMALLLLRSFIVMLIIIPVSCYGCQLEKESKYDLSPLSGFVWNSTVTNESDAFEFRFSLCEPLQEPLICRNSSVCRVRVTDGFATSVGNFGANVKTEETVDGFWATFLGNSNCPDGGFYKTIVKFECGKNLGLPKLLNWKGCFASFLWKTSAVCLDAKPKKEVPCYQFDSHGNLYDLTPLIKTTGSYSIKLSSAPVNFYINVCAEIAADGTSTSSRSRACSPGAGACRITGSEVVNFGDVETPLTLTSGGDLQIVYRNKAGPKPAGCTESPQTTITFVCPIAGGGKGPVVVSNNNCNLQVEWMTEYACPSLKIQSRGCRLYDEVRGINVDLSALKSVNEPFSVKGDISGTSFDFYLSACGGFAQNFLCSNVFGPDVMACRKSSFDATEIIIGQKNKTVLSYSNGELVIVSESDNAPSCPESANAIATATVIHLICATRAANRGVGVPVFLRKEDCTYFFEWHSKAACVETLLGSRCNAVNDSDVIDLSSLKRGPGEIPWEVESASDFERTRNNISRIFVNVCGSVRRAAAAVNCPIGTAVCVQKKDGTHENFGQFVRLPQIDAISGNVQITYTNYGEPCSSNSSLNRTTNITFVCWPGMNRSPREVHISRDGCFLDIEWITTAACVQQSAQGDNCKVEVPQPGFSFDLTPLKRDFYYLMSAGNYEYFLNLCGPLKGSDVPCIIGNTDVSACQVLKSDRTKFWSLGRSTEILSYDSGVLNVTYTGGSPDFNPPSPLRKTEILFECDNAAGIGEPTFVKQNGNVYGFLWRTSHACPLHPIQCVVTDNGGIQFDLSSLSRGYGVKNWIVDGNAGVDQSYDRYYINVCNAIGNSAPRGCDPSAGACATRVANNSEIVTTANMGKPVLPPYVENGKVMLKLVNGSQCPRNPSNNYTTFVYFLCSDEPEGQDAGIALLRHLPATCVTMFLWITKAACHISKLPASTINNKDACVVSNPFAEFTFDLSPLNVALHANSSSGEIEGFFVNVCGTVSPASCKLPPDAISSGVSACGYSVKNDGGLVIGLADTRTVEALTEDIISVKFDASKFRTGYEVEVLLKCRHNIEGNSLRFIREEMMSFIFVLETSVVCPPRPVDCFVHDTYRNLQYDLRPLARKNSNWVFPDGRLGLQDTRYIINVCRTVNGQGGSRPSCDGRNVGACMVDNVSGSSAIIGHVQSEPRVNEDGSITLRYLHGAPCGAGGFFYSMRINFLCAGEEGGPEFVDETPECEIIVDWKTAAACPFKQYAGSDCKVHDPKSGTTYDFSRLKNPAGYNVIASGKNFTLNMCGPLANGCHGSNTSGVCVNSENTQKSAGNYTDKMTFKSGVFTLHYDAEPDRGSLITLTCNRETNGFEGPSYVESSEDGPFIFLWPTSYACSYYKNTDCRIGGPDGKLYDLSGLTLKDRNHVVVSKDKKVKYSINVCHSVVLGEDLHCPFGAGICAVNASEGDVDKRYLNLGEVNDGPHVEDGILKVNYRMGGPCKERDGSSSHFHTTIWFYCHTRENEPRLVSEDNCEFRFEWFTSAACPINIPDNVGADCSVLDPLTGFRFNLSGLRNFTNPYRVGVDGNEFLLNVCEPVMSELSGSTSLAGSCQVSHVGRAAEYVNLGVANSQLHRRGDIIFLNYSNGEVCHDGAMTRNTLITFMCGEEGSGNGHPYFVGSSNNCTYFFNWKTELACEKKLNCLVEYNSEIFDLKQLAQNSEQPVAISKMDSGSIFLINVCSPLVTGPRVNCPPGAAVCRLQLGNQIGLNLGHARKEPSADNQGHITIEYVHGSPCPHNLRLNMSSKIVFICQEGSDKGIPELIEVTDDCVYMFQWRTYVVCPKLRFLENHDCTHFDATTRFTFDLNTLGDHDTMIASHDSNFTLNPCGSAGDSVAVRSWGAGGPKGESWGSARNSRFWYDGSALQVTYPDGDICGEKGRKSTTVWFVCEAGVGVGQPELVTVSDCTATFTWRTEHACHPSSSSCVAFLANSYSLVDLRYLSATKHSWVVKDSEGNAYVLNVCNGILPSEASESCTTSSSVCMKSAANGKIYELGNIATQRITSEDAAVTVRYTSRSDICAPQMFTEARIDFVCGTQVGVPYLVSKTNTTSMCSFYFLWKTRVACGSKSFRQVYSSDGLIEDPEFGWAANLTDIFNVTVHTVENRGSALIAYTINVNGLHFVTENPCNGSAICFNNSLDPTVCKSIGIATSRKLYVQNDELIVDFTTNEACIKNRNKNVSSSVSFSCSSTAGQGNPQFLYESDDCHYTFIWETSRMCSTFRSFSNETYDVANPTRISVGAVIGFVILAIVLCAITVILAQRNARMYVKDRVWSLFKNQSSPASTLHYSVLLNHEETALLTRSAAHRDIVLQRLPANESDSVIA